MKALVVLRAGAPADAGRADRLRARAARRLQAAALVEFVGELPRTPSGKVLKRELRERFGSRAHDPEAPRIAATQTSSKRKMN